MNRSIVLPVALLVLCLSNAAKGQTGEGKTVSAYRPGLGDLMVMTVQPRHTKLGLAAREGNWAYADYALDELGEALDRAARVWPRWQKLAVKDMIRSVMKEPMAALDRAIKARDAVAFDRAYGQLTQGCNTCHQSAERGMIVIQAPQASSFPDQDFRPAAR
jgi:hypothetical protein